MVLRTSWPAARASGVPHSLQNFAAAGLACPHALHVASALTCRVSPHRLLWRNAMSLSPPPFVPPMRPAGASSPGDFSRRSATNPMPSVTDGSRAPQDHSLEIQV